MAIPRFDEDLAIISKLGDNPGSDNNLTTDAFRAKFDEGPLKIQNYLNDVLIPAAEQSSSPQEGLSMQGGINMNGQKLNGIAAPEADDDAVNKNYVDDSVGDAVQEIKDSNYSVINTMTALAYSITLADKGLTIVNSNTLTGDFVVTFDKSVAANFPVGAEIAILRSETNLLKVAFTGGMCIGMAGNDDWVYNPTISIPERFGMIALKKIGTSSSDYWVLTGNVEVV